MAALSSDLRNKLERVVIEARDAAEVGARSALEGLAVHEPKFYLHILKGYMAAGEFSRSKDSIRASGGIVMVGNFDVDVEQQQRIGHLLSPLPPEMRNDTAFMDRIHAYAPGWDFPKLKTSEHLTNHFGLVTNYLSECWTKLRERTRISTLQGRAYWGGAVSGRDIEAVSKSISGLLKLLFPDPGQRSRVRILRASSGLPWRQGVG